MTVPGVVQILLFLAVLVALVKPLGGYMARVFEGNRMFLSPLLGPVERWIFRLAAVDLAEEQTWKQYTIAVLAFNALGFVVVYLLQRAQQWLPLNPQGFAAVSADSSFNTAISFASNTNWQGYGGETTLSYLTQMIGLGVQNFVSAACGMAVLVALIRGFERREAAGLGNFWVDLTRGTLHILLPLSLLLAIVLVSQGCGAELLALSHRDAAGAGHDRGHAHDRVRTDGPRSDPRPARSRSSSSARMAVASSTRTLPTRSRIRRHCRISFSCCPSC